MSIFGFIFPPSEQAVLEHGAQTPPPSPFSVQAFSRTMGSGAQGFDYGISNNKGELRSLECKKNLGQ